MIKKLLSVTIFIFLIVFFSEKALASARTDYEFQYGKYRQSYAEYVILKKDFLDNPTLENQQKAILSAKQSIVSRDKAKSSYARYFISLIQEEKINYETIYWVLEDLGSAVTFFDNQAQIAEKIVTASDLKTFSDNYLEIVVPHERSLRYAQVAYKISRFVHIQIEAKYIFDTVLPKLPASQSTALTQRLQDIVATSQILNSQIENMAKFIKPEEGEEEVFNPFYFDRRVEKFAEIKSDQIKFVNQLIDIDLNYAQP